MTIREYDGAIEELRDLGYRINENTQIIMDVDLRTRKEIIGFAFEDHGYKVTIKKEISQYDNDYQE